MRPARRLLLACTPAILAVGLVHAAATARADATYTITDLGNANPLGIDAAGDVLLRGDPGYNGIYHSYGPQAGTVTSFTAYGLPADTNTYGGSTQVAAIASNGTLYGTMLNPGVWQPFVDQAGHITTIGTLTGMQSSGNIAGNAVGQAVGIDYAGPGGANPHGYLFSNGQLTDLGANVIPNAINNNGAVTGVYNPIANAAPHAFLYQDGKMTDLGSLGGAQVVGAALNDHGQVVGNSQIPTATPPGSNSFNFQEHAFLYANGKMTDLGTLATNSPGASSEAIGINNAGQVVGTSGGSAFVWQSGTMTDLGKILRTVPSFTFGNVEGSTPAGINDLGQIIGNEPQAFGPNLFVEHGFLLTPTGAPAPASILPDPFPAPEPGTWLIFSVISAAGLLRAARKRRSRREGLTLSTPAHLMNSIS